MNYAIGPTSPRLLGGLSSRSQTYFSQRKSSTFDPSSARKSICLYNQTPRPIPCDRAHQNLQFHPIPSFQIPLDVQTMTSFLSRPRSTTIDLRQNPQTPSNITDLSLLTYILGKSAKRRFSWCNSQLLSPSGRRDMNETVFPPTSG